MFLSGDISSHSDRAVVRLRIIGWNPNDVRFISVSSTNRLMRCRRRDASSGAATELYAVEADGIGGSTAGVVRCKCVCKVVTGLLHDESSIYVFIFRCVWPSHLHMVHQLVEEKAFAYRLEP